MKQYIVVWEQGKNTKLPTEIVSSSGLQYIIYYLIEKGYEIVTMSVEYYLTLSASLSTADKVIIIVKK